MKPEWRFVVSGKAQPGGSKRAFYNKRTGRSVIVDANPKAKAWQGIIAAEARKAMGSEPPLSGPLRMCLVFYLDRPRSHYKTGKKGMEFTEKLAKGAPEYPIYKPDTTKLVRCFEDAMTGIVYEDDTQIVWQEAWKRYGPAGVTVFIAEL